jgi:hypothetical protein
MGSGGRSASRDILTFADDGLILRTIIELQIKKGKMHINVEYRLAIDNKYQQIHNILRRQLMNKGNSVRKAEVAKLPV